MSKLKLGNRNGQKNWCAYTPKYKKPVDMADLFDQKEEESEGNFFIHSHRTDKEVPSWGEMTAELREWFKNCEYCLLYNLLPINFHFELVSREDGTVLFIKYNQIIGSRCICYVK